MILTKNMTNEINWYNNIGFDEIDADTGLGIVKFPRRKSTCYIQPHFGVNNGSGIVEESTWKESFSMRSEAYAKNILSMENAPQESIDWAKKILNL